MLLSDAFGLFCSCSGFCLPDRLLLGVLLPAQFLLLAPLFCLHDFQLMLQILVIGSFCLLHIQVLFIDLHSLRKVLLFHSIIQSCNISHARFVSGINTGFPLLDCHASILPHGIVALKFQPLGNDCWQVFELLLHVFQDPVLPFQPLSLIKLLDLLINQLDGLIYQTGQLIRLAFYHGIRLQALVLDILPAILHILPCSSQHSQITLSIRDILIRVYHRFVGMQALFQLCF